MSDISTEDLCWQVAMDWVMREHEAPLASLEVLELQNWLSADVANGVAYQAARDVWLLTGCIPHSKD